MTASRGDSAATTGALLGLRGLQFRWSFCMAGVHHQLGYTGGAQDSRVHPMGGRQEHRAAAASRSTSMDTMWCPGTMARPSTRGSLPGNASAALRNSCAEPRMMLASRSVQRKAPTSVRPSDMRTRRLRFSSAARRRARGCGPPGGAGSAMEPHRSPAAPARRRRRRWPLLLGTTKTSHELHSSALPGPPS